MSQRTDAEFEHIIHDPDPAPSDSIESEDAKHLREELHAPHAVVVEDSRELTTH